jgi:hypothetical protein
VFINDVHSLGLPTPQGLQLTDSFYWNLNDQTRAFAKRFFEPSTSACPSMPAGRRLLGAPALPEGGQGRRTTTATRSSPR